jgi:hypothetical protein
MRLLKKYSILLLLFAILFCCFFAAGSLTRDHESMLFASYLISFLSYLFILYLLLIKKVPIKLSYLLILAVILRLGLFFSYPNLSDDFFRFSWDGNVVLDGSNPYQYKPTDYHFHNDDLEEFAQNNLLSSSETSFKNGMNSIDYYSVYPPVAQGVFITCSFLSENDLFKNVLYLRIFLLCFEIFGWFFMLKILAHYNLDKLKSMIYVLNPLVILELTGNLHFEGITFTFLLISFYFLIVNKYIFSGVAFAVAIGLKLIPVMFFPLIVYKIGIKKALPFLFAICLSCSLFFLPFFNIHLLNNFLESIQLYFHSFEFNASIYYVLRWLGEFVTGYNQIELIGSITPFVTVIAILVLTIWSRFSDNWFSLMKKMSWILLIYFSVASIVHPWYIVYLIGFTVFTGYVFPIAWAGVVFLSYMAYKNIGIVEEEPILIFIEYFIVLLAVIYDLNQKKIISFFLKDDGLKLPA